MSKETMAWLNANTLIGFTDKRGTAWHYRADLQAAEPNHYPGPVPVEAVKRRLFGWEAVASPVYVENPVTSGLAQVPDRQALVRSDTGHVMGIFSEGYEPHPYSQWLVDTVGLLLDDDLSIGSAGLLREGAVAWVSVEVPDTITTPEGVAFRPHLLACTSFDGSLATTFKRSITNVVKIKHSRGRRVLVVAGGGGRVGVGGARWGCCRWFWLRLLSGASVDPETSPGRGAGSKITTAVSLGRRVA